MQTLRLITTEKQLKLLEAIVYSKDEKLGVRKLAEKLGMNPGYVSVILKKMENEKLILEGKIQNTPGLQAIRFLFNVERLSLAWKRLRLLKIRGFGVYGSWAKGTNNADSDLDVWILMEKEPGADALGKIRNVVSKNTDVAEVSIMVLTKARIEELKQKDKLFYSSLLNSFRIGGDELAGFTRMFRKRTN